MSHRQHLWAILIEDEDGARFLPLLSGIVATPTKRECQQVLRQWRGVRGRRKAKAKAVRVTVRVV